MDHIDHDGIQISMPDDRFTHGRQEITFHRDRIFIAGILHIHIKRIDMCLGAECDLDILAIESFD